MSTEAVVLVLIAAILHAAWNGVVKSSGDRLIATWAVVATSAVVNVPILLVAGLPDRDVWWYVALSGAIHLFYNLALVAAYERADLSVAYPIARGTAPLLVTVGATLLLDDPVSVQGAAGVVFVSASLLVLATSRPLAHSQWAVITGLAIAGYTMTDGAGVRANGNSVQYIAAVFVVHAVATTLVVLRRRGVAPLHAALVAQPARLLLGGTASAGAYLLVMIAARTQPLGLVAGLRETSALFGLAIGAWLLHEPITRRQGIACVCAVVGTIAIATS